MYYSIRLCSSTGLLHPSQITSTTIAQTIPRQDSKSFVQYFAFWKWLPSIHHTTILRLCRFHLSYSGKNDKKSCLKYSIHWCFPTHFPASILSRLPTKAHVSGFSHQTKILHDMLNKMRLAIWASSNVNHWPAEVNFEIRSSFVLEGHHVYFFGSLGKWRRVDFR